MCVSGIATIISQESLSWRRRLYGHFNKAQHCCNHSSTRCSLCHTMQEVVRVNRRLVQKLFFLSLSASWCRVFDQIPGCPGWRVQPRQTRSSLHTSCSSEEEKVVGGETSATSSVSSPTEFPLVTCVQLLVSGVGSLQSLRSHRQVRWRGT